MNVLLDAHMVGEAETGNETYIVNLIRGLQTLGTRDRFLLATTSEDALSGVVTLDDQFRPVSVSKSSVRRLCIDLPRIAKKHRADVLHVTYTGPLAPPCPMISMVHDVSYKDHPEWFSLRDRMVLGIGVPRTLRCSAAVLTVTDYSKRQLQAHYGVLDEKLTVTPEAAAVQYRPIEDRSAVEKVVSRFGIAQPYVLALGNLQPRKNLAALIAAFASLESDSGRPVSLVIAGKDAYRASSIRRIIREHKLGSRAVLTGYVRCEDLPHLYCGAIALAYPSLYEGFGLPILEAMACGTPVVTSNVTSMPEVAGDAAILVDPTDVRSIADGLRRVVSDEALRCDLVSKGLARARAFSWRKTAQQTYDVYRQVVCAKD